MATSIASVRSLLASISGTFTLTALDTPAVTPLFTAFIPGPGLVIEQPEPHADALTLGGHATLGSAANVPVTVAFLPDTSGEWLGGMTITLELASFAFTAPWASFDGQALVEFGLAGPRLVLAAGTGVKVTGNRTPASVGSAQAAIEGAKAVTTTAGTMTANLRAVIPQASRVASGLASRALAFSADLSGMTLENLGKLAQFVTGASFSLPPDLPIASSVELTQIGLVFDPELGKLLSFSATVKADFHLPLFSGVGITDLWLAFSVDLAGASPNVRVTALTTLDLYTYEVDIKLLLPALNFEGSLHQDTPVPLKPFITNFLPVARDWIPDKFRLAVLHFAVELKEPHSYELAVEVDDLWSVQIGTGKLSVDSISVWLESDGTGSPALSISGRITFGTANLYLSFSRQEHATGWTVAGGTVDAAAFALPGGQTAGGIDVGAFIKDLGECFGGLTVPAPIASLVLTNLALSFQTGTDKFTFDCTGQFTIAETQLAMTVNIAIQPAQKGGYDAFCRGNLMVGTHSFTVIFDHEDTRSDTFIAAYAHTGPAEMVDLRDFVENISPAVATLIPAGILIGLRDIKLLFQRTKSGTPPTTSTEWLVSLDLDTKISLTDLPGISSLLPAGEGLALTALQIGYSSAALSAQQAGALNTLLAKDDPAIPPFVPVDEGVSFGADVMLGSQVKHFGLGVTQAKQPQALPPGPSAPAPVAPAAPGPPTAPTPAASSDGPVKWLDINSQFGPFSFQRIGAGYRDNILLFALDASVAVGPLALAMQGLSVGSRLTEFSPVFSLDGLSLTFSRPPIEIGGAFLRTDQDVNGKTVTSYYGELIVGVGEFSLKAVGGWTPDTQSFFLYLSIDAPIGGPPFLFVTGVAGGFGVNASLTLPSVDDVGTYILLPGIAPAEKATPAETIKAAIDQLKGTITPRAGEFWVAAGLRFTSFKMIQAQAVVSVAFGVEVQVGVVGVVTMTFPTGAGDDAIAHVEIDLVASFTPSTGLLAVDGKLSPRSFLLGGFVKLTGGFAFRTWFSGEHQGDFVVSLGGYHPAFTRPDNYPLVPRLGLEFALGPLKVTGASYFALTPNAFMAGLRLLATFEAGPVKAWFGAGVDFLIMWAPFHYEARAYVDIGVSLDLGLFTITIHVGADLEVWGPAFGGTALIDLTIVSFTIAFGAPKAPPPPIGWTTLATNFLPADAKQQLAAHADGAARARAAIGPHPRAAAPPPASTSNVVRADVPAGKLRADVTGADGKPLDWIIDPDHFRIVTTSAVPANHADWTTGAGALTSLPNDHTYYHVGLGPSNPAISTGGAAHSLPRAEPPTGVPDGMYLWLEPHTPPEPTTGPVWEEVLHVAPMDVSNVSAHHVIDLHSRVEGSVSYVTALAARPVRTASNTALWGAKPVTQTVNAPRLIADTLTGLELSPVPRHPNQVNAVPLNELAFQQSPGTEFAFPAPPADTSYTVTIQFSDNDHTLVITVTGAAEQHLTNTDYRLTCLTDVWVTAQRTSVLDELHTLGFATSTSGEVDLGPMAATQLADWPVIARMGAPE